MFQVKQKGAGMLDILKGVSHTSKRCPVVHATYSTDACPLIRRLPELLG